MDKMLERALKASVRDEVAARLGGVAASPAQVEELVAESVGELRLDYGAQLDPSEAHALVRALIDDFLYYGPLQPLLDNGSITKVMVNGGGVDLSDPSLPFLPPIVYVERAGRLEYRPDIAFDDAGHVRRIIDKIAEQAGVRCDEAHAMGCAMLPGGRARATFVVPPLAPDGPALNLRMFKEDLMGMGDLERAGALTPAMSDFLRSAVAARCPSLSRAAPARARPRF